MTMIFTFMLCASFSLVGHGISIGTTNKTVFVSLSPTAVSTVWINNQSSARQCLCSALSGYTNVRLLNIFTNGSCQLFFTLPYTYTLQHNDDSTLIFLVPLPLPTQAPCCSNLTWLVSRIKSAALPPVTLDTPGNIVIDDLDYLAVLSSDDTLLRYNRTTMALVSSTSVGSQCVSLTYYNRQYFVGCGTGNNSAFHVLSTSTLTSIVNISTPSNPRDAVFVRNGTVMIACGVTPSALAFYNVTSATSYTLASTMNAPDSPSSIYRVSDNLLYVSPATTNSRVNTLMYDNMTQQWTWNILPGTLSSSHTRNLQSTFDACGRLWLSVGGLGIRIFDATGSVSLYDWPLFNGTGAILLTDKFDLYVTDILNNRLSIYRPGIAQCTS